MNELIVCHRKIELKQLTGTYILSEQPTYIMYFPIPFLFLFCGIYVNVAFCHLCFGVFFDVAGSSVVAHDDSTSRGPTATAADIPAADSQSSAAPGTAPAAESTHVTPGNVSSVT